MKKEEGGEKLYGINPVIEALRAGRPFYRLYIARERKGSGIGELIGLAREHRVEIRFTPKYIIDKMAQGAAHQGILAFIAAKSYSALADVLDIAKKSGEKPFIILLDGIEDPRNLGAIIRVAEAGGVHGVILQERRSVGLTETVAKTSAGALVYMPVVKVKNLRQAIDEIKKEGLWVVGTDGRAENNLYDMDLDMPLALIIGSEGKGLRRGIIESCDFLLSIPMSGRTTSLNVSVAAGIIIYEALRQKRKTAKIKPLAIGH